MNKTEGQRTAGAITRVDFHSLIPMGVAQNLQASLDMCDGLEREPISEIRTQTQELISILRGIQQARGGSQIRAAKTKASLVMTIGQNGKMNSLLNEIQDKEELHDQVLEAVNRIRALAARTLELKRSPAPIKDPLYKLWIFEMTAKNSLGRELLQKIGEGFMGKPFTVRELAGTLGRDPKDPTNRMRQALAELSARSRESDFELVIDRSEEEYKYFINPVEKRDMTAEEIKQEIWINKVSPREGTHERRLARYFTSNLNRALDEETIAKELGISKQHVNHQIQSPINRIMQRSTETDFLLIKKGKTYILINHPIHS